MNVLVACEESQGVAKALRANGHNAFSCDLQECSGGHPEFHIKGDVLPLLKKSHIRFKTQDGKYHFIYKWDGMIGHPECTFLTATANKWMKPEFKDRFPNRQQQRLDAIDFFMKLHNAPIDKIAIENPVGIMSSRFRKPDQYVHPYYFGDPHSKKTGFWLKGLPKLEKTKIVEPEMYTYKDGRKDPMWHVETMKLPKEERTRTRSKTFPCIAEAMALQWFGKVNE